MTYRPSIAERIAWTSGRLRSAGVQVLVALWSCGDYETGRNCRPYVSTIVARSGLSRATVMRTLAWLRDKDQPGGPWVIASQRHRHATRYDIRLERLATHPPKAQQTTMMSFTAPSIDESPPDKSESQNEIQESFESHFEPLDTKFESHFETPTSDPDLVPVRTTTTTHAREVEAQNETQIAGAFPLVGQTPPRRCAHPHAHAWCDGRVHVPRDLHFELLDHHLGTQPGESRTAKAGRLIAFYAATMAALPASTSVPPDAAYTFWKAAFKAWIVTDPRPVEHEPVIARDGEGGVDQAPPAENVWTQVLTRIETKVNRASFYTWFRDTVLVVDAGDVIDVAKPGDKSDLFAAWLGKHYQHVVREAMEEVRPGTRVQFVVADGHDARPGTATCAAGADDRVDRQRRHASAR